MTLSIEIDDLQFFFSTVFQMNHDIRLWAKAPVNTGKDFGLRMASNSGLLDQRARA